MVDFYMFPDKEQASQFAAQTIYGIYGDLERWWNRMILGTATGQSPVLLYQYLKDLVDKSAWWKDNQVSILFRQLDNYISPGSSIDNLPPYSYQRELENSIWQIPNGGTMIPREYEEPEAESIRYAEEVKLSTEKADCIVQILGIGDDDGHIAFNMPGDPFDSTVHIVELNEETRKSNAEKFFDGDITKVPKEAITMGIGDILQSDIIFLLAFGKKKAEILWNSFFQPPTTEVPASSLQNFKGQLFVLLDPESASTIIEREGEDSITEIELVDDEKEEDWWLYEDPDESEELYEDDEEEELYDCEDLEDD